MSSVPANLKYYLKSLPDVSRNTFQLDATSNRTALSGGQITVLLQQNSCLNLDGIVMYATLNVNNGYAPPRNVESLFTSTSVSANGVTIQNPSPLQNLYMNTMMDLCNGTRRDNLRQVMSLGKDVAVPATGTTAFTSIPIALTNFGGFIGTATPRWLSLSPIGDLRVTIQLAGNEILTAGTGATGPGWSLSNIQFTCQTVSIDDGIYRNALEAKLASGSKMEIPFKYITSFEGNAGASGVVRASLASESVDWAAGIMRDSSVYLGNGLNGTTKNSNFFLRNGSNVTDSQLLLNNVPFPAFPLTNATGQVFVETMNNLNLNNTFTGAADKNLVDLASFNSSYWVHIHKWALDSEDQNTCFKSGISTIGNLASISWRYTGTNANNLPVLFIGCTGVLEVYSNRNLNVVF